MSKNPDGWEEQGVNFLKIKMDCKTNAMMKQTLFSLWMVLLAAGLMAQPASDLIRRAGDAEDHPGASQVVIYDSTQVDVQESGLSYVSTRRLIKVLNARGAKSLSVIKYGYDPLSAYVDIKAVKIYRNNGTVDVLNPATVQDYPAPARMIYWGAREKMIEVGRLETGDALEVELFRKGFTYALLADENEDDERYIPPMRGQYYDIVPFWVSHPTLCKVYQVKVPANKPLQYKFYNGEVQASVLKAGAKMAYTFVKRDLKPIKREPGMVAFSDVAPKLLMSTSPDWEAKSLWFYNVNEDFGSFETTPEITAKVNEILIGATNELDSISRLTHWVADEIRYSGISMGEGEGYTLHKGEMNFADRCGVCKDKAGMLITMLRAAGFESYPAMTMAGERIDRIPADQFNHSVTIVKRANGEYKILDPTWVPFVRELWSSAEQQQNYLMGIPEGADLMETPVSPAENHYIRIKGNSTLREDGSLEGELIVTAEGQTDASIRRMFTSNYKTEWNKAVESELLAIAPQAQIVKMDYGKPYQYMDGPIRIQIKYNIPNYALQADGKLIFTPLAVSGIFRRAMSHLYTRTSLESREYGFRDRCSRLVQLHEVVTLPKGASVVSGELNEESTGEAAHFKSVVKPHKNLVNAEARGAFNKRIYRAEEWPEYRDAVKTHQRIIDNKVVVLLKK